VKRHDAKGFGSGSNEGECGAVCTEGDIDHQHQPYESRVFQGDAGDPWINPNTVTG
jgi:hypothetical protein